MEAINFTEMTKEECQHIFKNANAKVIQYMNPKYLDYACDQYKNYNKQDTLHTKDISQIEADIYAIGTQTKKYSYMKAAKVDQDISDEDIWNNIDNNLKNKYSTKTNMKDFVEFALSAGNAVIQFDTTSLRQTFGWSTLQAANVLREVYRHDENCFGNGSAQSVAVMCADDLYDMGASLRKHINDPQYQKELQNDYNGTLVALANRYAENRSKAVGYAHDFPDMLYVAKDPALIKSLMNASKKEKNIVSPIGTTDIQMLTIDITPDIAKE